MTQAKKKRTIRKKMRKSRKLCLLRRSLSSWVQCKGSPQRMNEFFWVSKSSTRLGKTQLSLPIILNDLIDALKPFFKQKCFKDYVEDSYRLGIVIPLYAVPVGRK